MTPTLLSFFLFFAVEIIAAHAQPSNADLTDGQMSLHPAVAIIVGIFSLVLIIFLVLIYARFCRNNIRGRPTSNSNGFLRTHNPNPNRTTSGIDKTVIESLPFFRFSSLRGKRDGLECAVCLSKFNDMEILRLLPKCKHAFHMDCIDCWLEVHSTCPLCRHRIDPNDAGIFNCCSNSTRSLFHEPSHQGSVDIVDDTATASNISNIDLELFIERAPDKEEDQLLKSSKNDREQELLQLHKHKHRIVVSGSMFKGRWSDLNSSDLVSLDSEMLLDMISSKRFSNTFLADTDRMHKIKEEMGKKRVLESKTNEIWSNLEMMSSPSIDYSISMAPLLSPGNKCRSEITTVMRFQSSGGGGGDDEKVRKIWLPIARRTVQLFAGRERRPEPERTVKEAAIV